MIAGTLEIQLLADMARLQKDMNDAKNMIGGAMQAVERSVSVAKAALGGLLAGLAAGVSIAAFTSIIKGSVESAAALHDLSIQTGASVEALTGLAAVGKFSDFGAEQIGGMMNKMAKNLAGATEESKGTGKALQALGIDFDQFKRLAPEEQMVTVAKAMNKFEDGTGKAAVAMAIYGREGAQALPFMKDLAVAGALQAKVTTEQAAMADNFSDNMLKVKSSGDAWKKELAMGLLPAMSDLSDAWLSATNGSGGLRDQVRKLSADGTLETWARGAVVGLTYLIDVGQGLISIFPLIGKGIAGVVAATSVGLSAAWEAWQRFQKADFDGAWAALKNGVAGVKSVAADASADIAAIWNQELLGEKIRKGMEDAKKARTETNAEAAKAKLDFTNVNEKDESLKAANKELKEQEKLLAELSGLTGTFYADWDRLNAMYAKGRLSLEQLTSAQAALLDKQPAIKKAHDEEKKALEELAKANLAAAEAHTKFIADMFAGLDKLKAENKAQQDLNDRIGLTKEQIAALDAAKLQEQATALEGIAIKKLDKDLDETQYGLYKAQAEELRKLAKLKQEGAAKQTAVDEAQKSLEAWKKMSNDIERTLTDALMRGFESGKGFARNLRDTVVNMFKTMVLRPVISAVLNPVANTVTGMFMNGAGNAASNAVSNGLLQGGVSAGTAAAMNTGGIAGMTGGLSSGLSVGAGTASTADAAMFASAQAAGNLSAGASLGAQIAAAAPYLAAVAVAYAIYKSLDDSGTPHTGAASRADQNGVAGIDARTLGTMEVQNSDAMRKVTDGVATSIVTMLNSTATTLGKTAAFAVSTAFADDSSKDGAWGALRIERNGTKLLDWADDTKSRWAPREYSDGDAGFKEYTAEIAKSVRSALDDIGLPGWATAMLDSLGNAPTIEQLGQTIDKINAAQIAFANLGGAITAFATMTDAAKAALVKAAGGVDSLVGSLNTYYDLFYTEEEKRANLARQVTTALAAQNLTMPKTREEYRQMVETQLGLGESGATAATTLLNLSQAINTLIPAAQSATTAVGKSAFEIAEGNRASAINLVDVMFEGLTRSVEAERKRITNAYEEAMAAINTSIEAVSATVDTLKNRSSSLRGAIDRMRASDSGAAYHAEGQAFLVMARSILAAGGKFTDDRGLQRALDLVSQPTEDLFGSFVEYQRDFYQTAITIDDLSMLTDSQLTAEEQSLATLQDQKQMMEVAYQAEMSRLDGILATAQEQVNAIHGVDTSIQSITSALSSFTGAIASARAVGAGTTGSSAGSAAAAQIANAYETYLYRSPEASGFNYWTGQVASGALDTAGAVSAIANSNEAKIQQLYGSILGRVGEAAGVAYWTDRLNSGDSYDKLKNEFYSSAEYVSKTSQYQSDVANGVYRMLPQYANGGNHAGGWRVVGERGPELEYTGPSTIVSNATTSRMLDMSSVEQEVKGLRSDMRQMQALVIRNTARMADTVDRWEKTGMPESREMENA